MSENKEVKKDKVTMEELLDRESRRKEVEAMRTSAVGNMGLNMTGKLARIQEIKVLDDRKLLAAVKGKVKPYTIMHEPITCYMDMKNYWIMPGVLNWIKMRLAMFWLKLLGMSMFGYLKFNLYVFKTEGEYTLDPTIDTTPEDLQRRIEAFLQTQNIITNAKIGENMMKGARDVESIFNKVILMFLIAFVVVIGMFLFVLNGGTI